MFILGKIGGASWNLDQLANILIIKQLQEIRFLIAPKPAPITCFERTMQSKAILCN
jgi:hypothetical protein